MMKKRIALLVTACFVATSFLSACTSNNKSGDSTANSTVSQTSVAEQTVVEEKNDYGDTGGLTLPLTDKPVTLTCMVASTFPDREKTFVMQELAKRTGVSLDMQEVPNSQFVEKLKVMVSSGKLTDIVSWLNLNDTNKIGIEGALEPINQLLDELPNFRKIYTENPANSWVMKSYTAEDNNLYMWPTYKLQRNVNHGFMYRKDIFDKYGIKEWTNTEEFYQALKKLKQEVPDSIPYVSKTMDFIFQDWSFGWGIGNDLQFPMYYDENQKTWKMAGAQPEWKDMLDFMKKLYNEGLMDPEFISSTPTAFTEKMSSDKSFVTFDWIGRMEMFYQQVKAQNPDYNLRYANPVGPVGKIRKLPEVGGEGFCVPKGDKSLIALKLLDYWSSPSGARLMTMGMEGATFKKDASGNISYIDIEEPVDINKLQEKYGAFLQGTYLTVDPESVYFKFTEKEKEAQDKMVNNGKISVPDPMLKFNAEEREVINEMLALVKKEVSEFSSKYVIDKNYGDSQWQEWLNKVEKMQVQKLVDAYNSAQKRYDN